jgi:hypothetical protein
VPPTTTTRLAQSAASTDSNPSAFIDCYYAESTFSGLGRNVRSDA